MNVSVILPSLNPDEKLVGVVKGLIGEGFKDIIVVNDGSSKEHMEPFGIVSQFEEITILTHEVNKGKGRALKTAYEYCIAERPDIDGVVTADADGQHTPSDIKACCEEMLADPKYVILGCRDFSEPGVPWKSRVGNNITSFMFKSACGIRLGDTQTGLRAFSAEYLRFMADIPGDRYEYETRVLLEMKKNDIDFKEVKIETVYIEDNRESHFHPVKDSYKIYKVIFKHSSHSFIKFALSSLSSWVVDIGMFYLFLYMLNNPYSDNLWIESFASRELVATISARVLSSVFNYVVNRLIVFKGNKSDKVKSVAKYYLLVAVQMAASYGLVYLFATVLKVDSNNILTTVVKCVVDILLFLISFQIQKRWVFKKDGRVKQ